MIWPGNFLIHKINDLVDDSDLNKTFHLNLILGATLYLKPLLFL